MKKTSTFCALCVSLGLLGSTGLVSGQTPSYTYTDLGVPTSVAASSNAFSYATGINDSGTIVGEFGSLAGYQGHAFSYANGTMTDLSQAITGSTSGECYAYGIDAAGDIVGAINSYALGETPSAFLLPAEGGVASIPPLSPGSAVVAYGINNSGQIVGWSMNSAGNGFHAYIYAGGQTHDLGVLQTGSDQGSIALNVNDSGVVVGNSVKFIPGLGYDDSVGFYTTSYATNTGLVSIGGEAFPIAGGGTEYTKDIAYNIDSTGTIVGGAVPICPGEAFTYKNGAFTYLGVLSGDDSSYATAKNNAGAVVGASFIWENSSGGSITGGASGSDGTNYFPGGVECGTTRRAFVYQNGQMYDLNAVTSNIPAGWTLVAATGINSSGQIVGYAIHGTIQTQPTTVTHAFLLKPSTDPFNGSSLGGGYYYSSWFGIYDPQFYPWIYRTDLGFIYVDAVGTDLYLYVDSGNGSSSMGWVYTNQSIFPNVYSFAHNSWLYYFSGGTSFYNYTTQSFENY